MQKKSKLILGISLGIIGLIIILIGALFIYQRSSHQRHSMDSSAGTHQHEPGMVMPSSSEEMQPAPVKKTGYHCPMHPNYTSDKPGKCPICGMDLVPNEEPKPEKTGEMAMEPGSVMISPEVNCRIVGRP